MLYRNISSCSVNEQQCYVDGDNKFRLPSSGSRLDIGRPFNTKTTLLICNLGFCRTTTVAYILLLPKAVQAGSLHFFLAHYSVETSPSSFVPSYLQIASPTSEAFVWRQRKLAAPAFVVVSARKQYQSTTPYGYKISKTLQRPKWCPHCDTSCFLRKGISKINSTLSYT